MVDPKYDGFRSMQGRCCPCCFVLSTNAGSKHIGDGQRGMGPSPVGTIKRRNIMASTRASLGFVWLIALCSLLLSLTSAVDASKGLVQGRGAPGPAPEKVMEAAGYCPSSGGSTEYESINHVNLETLPDKKTMRLTVGVYIANPAGCVAGEPCPSYDASPEYVNAWLDWNGNQQFEASEKVMDLEGSGYLNINYSGTMTFVKQFAIPAEHVAKTWLRVNLGYGHDPNDPCEQTWGWGNVVDREVELEVTKFPEIKDIEITPHADFGVPVTNKDLKFTAEITEVDGFENEKVVWVIESKGRLKKWDVEEKDYEKDNNEWEIKPQVGTYGRNVITATLYYRDKSKDEEGQATFKKSFNLYFEKSAKDKGANQPPNWYTYWVADNAFAHKNASMYVSGKPCSAAAGYSYGACCSDGKVLLYDCAAADRAAKTYNFGGTNKTVYNTKGIDTAAQVLAHEFNHKMIGQKNAAGGDWHGKTNSDFVAKGPNDARNYDDRLPDEVEKDGASETYPTDKTKTDTFNVNAAKSPVNNVYKYYGDEEYTCILAGDGASGVAEKDWSHNGKIATAQGISAKAESSPLGEKEYVMSPEGAARLSGVPADEGSRVIIQQYQEGLLPETVKIGESFTSFSESSVDSDGDGYLDELIIAFTVNIPEGLHYIVHGRLADLLGNEVAWATTAKFFNAGQQPVELHFAGTAIFQSGLNGPYVLKVVEVAFEDNQPLEVMQDAFTTSSYQYDDFQHPPAWFGSACADTAKDTNGNGKFDVLEIQLPVSVKQAGHYGLSGWLQTGSGESIAYAQKETDLTAGNNQVLLSFAGREVRWAHVNGSYTLGQVTLTDQNGKTMVSAGEACSTEAYDYTDFEGGAVELKSYQATGVDTNSNGLFDELKVEVTMEVIKQGRYILSAILTDGAGNEIAEASADLDYQSESVPTGKTAGLSFAGGKIFASQTDGPYHLRNVLVSAGAEGIADRQTNAFTTSAFKYNQFEPPLAFALDYSDSTVDDNVNGLHELLNVTVMVQAKADGVVKAEANLSDSQGNILVWSDNFVEVSAQTSTPLVLSFAGEEIGKSGKNGPYYLNNLNVYHTGDPAQNFFQESAYSTKLYHFYEFEFDGTFVDVPNSHWAFKSIEILRARGVTSGCSEEPMKYCPGDLVTRAQMAKFLLISKHGEGYAAPDAVGVFADVPTSHWAADWIEQLYGEGYTSGCADSPLRYCPEDVVTRGQMAKFLLKIKHGNSYEAPPATGIFADVPVSHWAGSWIEQLYNEGITSGCADSPLRFCPEDAVTREQMAAFLARTFGWE